MWTWSGGSRRSSAAVDPGRRQRGARRSERQFAALYGRAGRPSIPPEMLPRAMLLQAFYSIRSERQLMERLEFDLLFRVVRRFERRRAGVGSLDVLQEPRSAF